VNGHVHAGRWTAATPDGRHKGAPLVDGVGACQGADRSGPTALLQSVARLDNIAHWPAGNTCNIKFSATSVRNGQGVDRVRDLATTFFTLGGQELQVNVVDAATLRAAQADPEAHRDLIVRVAGYSAYFAQLDAAVQDEIISRTEQEA
jgi:formate C-acetyltransferase